MERIDELYDIVTIFNKKPQQEKRLEEYKNIVCMALYLDWDLQNKYTDLIKQNMQNTAKLIIESATVFEENKKLRKNGHVRICEQSIHTYIKIL